MFYSKNKKYINCDLSYFLQVVTYYSYVDMHVAKVGTDPPDAQFFLEHFSLSEIGLPINVFML